MYSASGLEDRLNREDNQDGKLGCYYDTFLDSYQAYFKIFQRANRHPGQSERTTLNNELHRYENDQMFPEEYDAMKQKLRELELIIYKSERNFDNEKCYKKNLKLRRENSDTKYRLGFQNEIRLTSFFLDSLTQRKIKSPS